jgi:ABC-type multidrug transport system fused ATPase/permease subunit
MVGHNDWSERHVRLRRRLIILSLAIFFLARLTFPKMGFLISGSITGQPVTKAEAILVLAVAFIYAFLEFSARTRAEAKSIASYSRKLQRTLHAIDQVRARTALAYSSFDGAMLSRRLEGWDATLKAVEPSSRSSDSELYEIMRDLIDRLHAIREGLEEARPDPGFAPPVVELNESGMGWESNKRDFLAGLERLTVMVAALAEMRRELGRTTAESREVLSDARGFFADQMGGVAGLNEQLTRAVASIQGIQNELRSGSRDHYLDRYVFSVHLPKALSIILVVLSADAIIIGAAQFANRVHDLTHTVRPFVMNLITAD